MKKRILLTALLTLIFCFALTMAISAATYYVDYDGNLVESTSENIAYEYDRSNSNISNVYLHDSTITKIVIPDMSDFTGTIQLQASYGESLGIYEIKDKEAKANNLMTQIKEIVVFENIYLDGAYTLGAFAGYTGLEKISFYGKVGVSSKGGFFENCTNLTELHFYGKDLAVPSVLLSDLGSVTHNKAVTIAFHEGATGTLSTGADTLPTYSNLGGWRIIINENIKPSNASDPRLGKKWGQTISTTGWELIVAVESKGGYTEAQLDALKTSHGFASRAESVEAATIKEAVVMSYCELGYSEHNNKVTFNQGANLLLDEITKVTGCDKCLSGETEKLSPVFVSVGYSVNLNGSLMQGFAVNRMALAQLKDEAGYEINFGLVAGNKDKLTGTALINSDGTANQELGAKIVTVDYTRKNFDVFEMKLSGFTSEYENTNVYCCAYYIINGEVYYISNKVVSKDVSDMSTTYAALLENSEI